MVRKPMIPTVSSRVGAADKSLAVKDGLREVRFTVRQGARRLIEAVEAATHGDEAAQHGPLGSLGKPLNLAVRTAATLLSNVDHAAVNLLAPDADYRSMSVPLCPSASYFNAAGAASDLRDFTTDHHWRYRHWLEMSGHDDVFVHEQAIATAGAEVAETALAGPFVADDDSGTAFGAVARHITATVVMALARQDVLSKAALLPGEANAEVELADLRVGGAVVSVLAGEIAGRMRAPAEADRYLGALRLGDEIANAERANWQAALRAPDAVEALGRWFGFVLRHL